MYYIQFLLRDVGEPNDEVGDGEADEDQRHAERQEAGADLEQDGVADHQPAVVVLLPGLNLNLLVPGYQAVLGDPPAVRLLMLLGVLLIRLLEVVALFHGRHLRDGPWPIQQAGSDRGSVMIDFTLFLSGANRKRK